MWSEQILIHSFELSTSMMKRIVKGNMYVFKCSVCFLFLCEGDYSVAFMIWRRGFNKRRNYSEFHLNELFLNVVVRKENILKEDMFVNKPSTPSSL